jgi:hypothetical protein
VGVLTSLRTAGVHHAARTRFGDASATWNAC